MNKIGFKPIPAAIALGLALLIWFVIPVPDGVTPQAWHLLAMFVGVIAAINRQGDADRGIVDYRHDDGGFNAGNGTRAGCGRQSD